MLTNRPKETRVRMWCSNPVGLKKLVLRENNNAGQGISKTQ